SRRPVALASSSQGGCRGRPVGDRPAGAGRARRAGCARVSVLRPRADYVSGVTERRAWELAGLAVILLVAGWLRLRHLDLMEFKSDEAVAVRIGRDILH